MKNVLENIAIALVAIFSLAIVVLIIQYNLISGEEDEVVTKTSNIEVSKEAKNIDYVKNLEQYSDVDVNVDPKTETSKNKIKVKSEFTEDKLDNVLKETRSNSVVEGINDLLGN